MLFFPQLAAGPIERPRRLLGQLRAASNADRLQIYSGLRLMCLGYVKKVFVADTLAPFVDEVYAQPTELMGPALGLATLYFLFQIYCDFSGYTDMALGCARILGFQLSRNFQRPFLATSLREFWRRWHISLGTWFRDYVYPHARRYGVTLGLILTFGLSGFWHGAHAKFLLWGLYHGILVAFERGFPRFLRQGWLGRGLMLLLLVWSMPLFRAQSLQDALYVQACFFAPGSSTLPLWPLLLILLVYGLEYLEERGWLRYPGLNAEMACIYASVIVAAVTYSELTHGDSQGLRQFVYFQF